MDHPTNAQRQPVTDLRRVLRQEVGLLRRHESRRVFEVSVHVGVPGGERVGFAVQRADLPLMDAGMRTDLLTRLLEDPPFVHAWAWLTRPGVPELHDLDVAWFASARVAYAVHGRTLTGFYAVTRTGWLDVRTGESRTWKRLRL